MNIGKEAYELKVFDVPHLISLFESKVCVLNRDGKCRDTKFWLEEIMIEAKEGNIDAKQYLAEVLKKNLVEREMIRSINIFFDSLSCDKETQKKYDRESLEMNKVIDIFNFQQKGYLMQCRVIKLVLSCKN